MNIEEIIKKGYKEDLTEEEAVFLFESEIIKTWTPEQITNFQLRQGKLCVEFDIFHQALQKTLDRLVWTHELGINRQGLIDELEGKIGKPTMEEIINLIPKEKQIVVTVSSDQECKGKCQNYTLVSVYGSMGCKFHLTPDTCGKRIDVPEHKCEEWAEFWEGDIFDCCLCSVCGSEVNK